MFLTDLKRFFNAGVLRYGALRAEAGALGTQYLLLDEPTRSVDVGTRDMIFDALHRAAADGMSTICAGSDAEQLAEICDRILVFTRGKIVNELTGSELSKAAIAAACYASQSLSPSPNVAFERP